ncbi:MAG: hypothetical protein O7H41_20310 [Planctomycetota bacterium]|nr:hypothetical protein [Planctomycetota bacterium]
MRGVPGSWHGKLANDTSSPTAIAHAAAFSVQSEIGGLSRP